MKLSRSTIDVLKNFAQINNGMVIHAGNRIRIQDNLNKQIAYANIEDEFPRDFAVYDLGEFLSALNLVPNADLDFGEKTVVISNDTTSLTFRYANSDFVVEAPEAVNFPPLDNDVATFKLRGDDLTSVLKASNTLGLPEIRVSTVKGSSDIKLSAINVEGGSKHAFEIKVGETDVDVEYQFDFDSELLTIVKQDYDVMIHPAGIGRFENETMEYNIVTRPE